MQDTFVARAVFMATIITMVVVFMVTAASAASKPPLAEMPQYNNACMACLCKAVGKNGSCVSDVRLTCVHLDTFGPFCISLPFWIDAGKPVLPGDNKDLPGAFVRCVEEPFCAVRTIRGYMETGPGIQDCDKNGIYNCRDLILTHLHGRYNCKDQPDNRVTSLEECMGDALRLSPRPSVAPPRRAQAPPLGGRGSTSPTSSAGSGVAAFPADGWPHDSYGRGAVGAGWRNPIWDGVSSSSSASRNSYGTVGNVRNIPRDSFNALQSGTSPPWEGVGIPDGADSMGDKMKLINNMREIEDAMRTHAQRLAEDFARRAELRELHRNSLPSYSDETEGTSDSSRLIY